MRIETIAHPKTGRQIRVKAWDVEPRAILADLKAGVIRTGRDLSWKLLSDRQSIALMEGGEGDERNFALDVVEQALDWTLGLTVLNFIRAAVKAGKMPKPFKVAASRRGDVFIITASGRVLA